MTNFGPPFRGYPDICMKVIIYRRIRILLLYKIMGEKIGSLLVPWKIRAQTLKITCFSHFFATRWRRNHSKTPFLNSQRPLTPILTPQTCLISLWGPNGEKIDFEPSTGPKFFENDPKNQFFGPRNFSYAGLGAPRVRIFIIIHFGVIYAKKTLTRHWHWSCPGIQNQIY